MHEKSPIKDLILLAGRDHADTFSGKNVSFLLEVGGETVIENVLRAVEDSVVERVIIVGPVKILEQYICDKKKQYHLVESQSQVSRNILAGINNLNRFSSCERAILLASDLPFLSQTSINWLADLNRSTHSVVPIVTKNHFARFSTYYSTYFWPNSPEPFKWGDAALIQVCEAGKAVSNFIDKYRASWSQNEFITIQRRIGMLLSPNASGALPMLLCNYVSKLTQRYTGGALIPFSDLFKIADYEKALSAMSGMPIAIAEAPNAELSLDLDSEWRHAFYNKRFQEIRQALAR